VAKIQRDTAAALRDPAVNERLASEGAEPVGNTPEQFGTFIRSEIELWGKVIRATGMKAE
jgi:tripartite-type tricarboxylate transporter receptor subunit TctC